MKTFVLFSAIALASGFAMAKSGAGGDQLENKVLYDVNGKPTATVINIPEGCTAVPTHAGDGDAVIVLCEEI